ncbi:hypothetical protein [uncultured Erythrobacter sp.]|uniref:hypothetical protein n=1 Tax=uncultured Erythrobacter sp. TaxID=263913 RepID=UPI00262DB651|nr:hypothetical protein [uncultured Erythrobacter sp.]
MSFADDPAEHFKFDLYAAHHQSSDEILPFQLVAAKRRFADLVDRLPPLAALAEHRSVSEIGSFDDLAKVLFHHSMFKSYPQEALFEGEFDTLIDWLGNFTTNDLSIMRGRDFSTIDAWFDALNTDTAMHLLHSSGTTGQLSLIPRGKLEHQFSIRHTQMALAEVAKPGRFDRAAPDYKVVWPAYAGGWSGVLTFGDMLREVLCANDTDFFAQIPDRQSVDHQLYVMQIENARASGQEFIDAPSDYVKSIIDRSFVLRDANAKRVEELLERITGEWRGQKVVFAGGPVLLYNLAKAGLAMGLEGVLAEGSRILNFGGFKGVSPVGDEEAVIKRFTGVPHINGIYGMSEMTTAFIEAETGNYHVPPWIIPFVIDPETGEAYPQEGVQTGIAAFMDLTSQTYWGGLITADRITVSWERSPCGRTTPFILPNIERVEV